MTDSDNLVYAGFWIRTAAALIDVVLILCITSPILYLVYGPEYWTSSAGAYRPFDVLISWILPAVATIVFWHYRSATPGKMALSVRIVDARTGRKPSLRQLTLRYLGYFPAVIPLGVGILWVAFDGRKQGWHDKIAGTVVVRPARGTASAQFADA